MRSACECPVDPNSLLKQTQCLSNLSKDVVEGRVGEPWVERRVCPETQCVTLTTLQKVTIQLKTHTCDSKLGQLLDGVVEIHDLVHVFNGDGKNRGIHSGTFQWTSKGGLIIGELSGITNAGTHRAPAFKECQRCDAPGFLEGQFCGTVVRPADKGLVNAYVFGDYRLLVREPSPDGFHAQGVTGTLEGVIGVPCLS